jgi:hypothetical protein
LERPEKPLTALEKAMNKIAMVQDADLTGIWHWNKCVIGSVNIITYDISHILYPDASAE